MLQMTMLLLATLRLFIHVVTNCVANNHIAIYYVLNDNNCIWKQIAINHATIRYIWSFCKWLLCKWACCECSHWPRNAIGRVAIDYETQLAMLRLTIICKWHVANVHVLQRIMLQMTTLRLITNCKWSCSDWPRCNCTYITNNSVAIGYPLEMIMLYFAML